MQPITPFTFPKGLAIQHNFRNHDTVCQKNLHPLPKRQQRINIWRINNGLIFYPREYQKRNWQSSSKLSATSVSVNDHELILINYPDGQVPPGRVVICIICIEWIISIISIICDTLVICWPLSGLNEWIRYINVGFISVKGCGWGMYMQTFVLSRFSELVTRAASSWPRALSSHPVYAPASHNQLSATQIWVQIKSSKTIHSRCAKVMIILRDKKKAIPTLLP